MGAWPGGEAVGREVGGFRRQCPPSLVLRLWGLGKSEERHSVPWVPYPPFLGDGEQELGESWKYLGASRPPRLQDRGAGRIWPNPVAPRPASASGLNGPPSS